MDESDYWTAFKPLIDDIQLSTINGLDKGIFNSHSIIILIILSTSLTSKDLSSGFKFGLYSVEEEERRRRERLRQQREDQKNDENQRESEQPQIAYSNLGAY